MNEKELIKKIVDKKFESVINGYSPSNVDSFLDSIIKDIELLYLSINEQNEKINNLKEEIKSLKSENNKLESDIKHLKNNEDHHDDTEE